MSDSVTTRAAAGVSFLFAPGQRPDAAAWRSAIGGSQTRAKMVREDAATGAAELVVDGLSLDVDGLAPAAAGLALGLVEDTVSADVEAVRLYPGHHLSGGLGMMPVVRTLIALAAEVASRLQMRGVYWHPAATHAEPQPFAHAAWAWLAGGIFPARVLTALSVLADGSVTSRGLAHFTGREMTLRPRPGEPPEEALRLAERIVDHLVRHGGTTAIGEQVFDGEMLCFEPARRGAQVWVWRKAD